MQRHENYAAFFEAATGNRPYPYQARLAEAERLPDVLSIPTGLGKTAAIVLGWLWRRRHAPAEVRSGTPRRLVFCLPMRVLVEQTERVIQAWRERLNEDIGVHCLMGGEREEDWDLHPERDAIVVGTQDMLLSRALNRGYAMSRFRWPVAFGLLNSDVLWVLDEVQLMGSGLATTAQLAAFREKLGTVGSSHTLWTSATLERDWLRTIDFAPRVDELQVLQLAKADRAQMTVRQRFEARKRVIRAPFSLEDDSAKSPHATKVANLVEQEHREGGLSLVMLNTVSRAVRVYEAIERSRPDADLVLLHSRFRAAERRAQRERLEQTLPPAGRIVVSTQVVEAGMDIDARLLVTELAPWASLVQRFGRCNRAGTFDDAVVHWLDVDERLSPPYDEEGLRAARATLAGLDDVGPKRLVAALAPPSAGAVLRQRDLVDLFDTSPDLSGADIDVSAFIREDSDRDVRVYWRQGSPSEDEKARPEADEICTAPIGDMRRWLGKKRAWRFSQGDGVWENVGPPSLYPGAVLRLDAADGGYDPQVGFDPRAKKPVPLADSGEGQPEGVHGGDSWSERTWQTLRDHTARVAAEMLHLLDELDESIPEAVRQALEEAAWLHDVGKTHAEFQRFLLGDPAEEDPETLWAKTARRNIRHRRPHFRHELASGLALLQSGRPDLVAYLAAAHHGKVRLSVRSFPTEKIPEREGMPTPYRRFALGIWDGETLPAIDLGEGRALPETILDLSLLEIGEGNRGPGWSSRMIALRDDPSLGPFRLAFYEALIRAADRRASKEDR